MAQDRESIAQALVDEIRKAFSPVIGLKLSIARNAGNMKVFHFGEVRPHPRGGTMGSFAFHVQCPWRIVGEESILTGSQDYYEPADSDARSEESQSMANLQEKHLLELFQGYDSETKSCKNITDLLVVESVEADIFGGLDIRLSGGYRLQLFPVNANDSSTYEEWRLFEPFGKHFVVMPNGDFEWLAPDGSDHLA
jgi:hypothetical protein